MSRGRKPNTENKSLNWEQLYGINQGSYFQLIISKLGRINITKFDTGSELLKIIKLEKNQFVKNKEIFPSLREEEIPYKIPDNWVWCRLGEITNYGISPKVEPSQLKRDTWVLDLEDIEKSTSRLICKLRNEKRNSLSTKSKFQSGDVLYSKLRPYLDKVIVADEDGVCTTEILPLKCYGGINPHYFKYTLKTLDFVKYVNSLTRGMKMPRLGTKEGKLALIPLPPISEQNEIVEFLLDFSNNNLRREQYFNKTVEDEIVNLHKSLLLSSENFNLISNQLTLIENLNQAILQEAVQGKLVKQDKKDEPAMELLKRIKAEKVKSGKKEKPLPPIKPEEIPFVIPENWVWCTIDEVANLFTGNSINENIKSIKYAKVRDGFQYIGTKDVEFDGLGINYNTGVKIPFDEIGFRKAKTNAILICIEGGSSGKKYAITDREICFGNKLLASEINELLNAYCFYYFYQSSHFKSEFKLKSKGLRGGVSINQFKEILIPIPPKEEQSRILAEIEKQLAKTKQLKEHIIANQQATEQLLKALLHQAFEVEEMEGVS
jgi:type I restriction enzyme S subunit